MYTVTQSFKLLRTLIRNSCRHIINAGSSLYLTDLISDIMHVAVEIHMQAIYERHVSSSTG